MFIRQSALSCSVALSARSRSTTANRSAISPALVRCSINQPFFCQSAKLMVRSNDEGLGLTQHSGQEMVSATHLANEFLLRVNRWIDIAAKTFLRATESRHDLRERDTPNDEQVDIARGTQRASRRGAIDERDLDPIAQRH